MSRTNSGRRISAMRCPSVEIAPPSPLGLTRSLLASSGCEFHRTDDFRICRAAAQVAGQIMTYLVVTGIGVFIQQLLHHHDEAGRAEAALEGARLDKGFLNRIEFLARCQSFDGFHPSAVGQHCKKKAAGHGLSVHIDGAATAKSLPAAFACTS